jgi:3-polyprenyl-4-hydroxybenzoate decarboxylase
MELVRRINTRIYTREAVESACRVYDAYCTVRLVEVDDGFMLATVVVKGEYEREARQVMLEFWNYLLDLSCQHRLESA